MFLRCLFMASSKDFLASWPSGVFKSTSLLLTKKVVVDTGQESTEEKEDVAGEDGEGESPSLASLGESEATEFVVEEWVRERSLSIGLYRKLSSENWRGPRPSGRGGASLKDCP